MSNKLISLNLSNYYGVVKAVEIDGKYFLTLGDCDEDSVKEISKEFYLAVVKEFTKEEC